MTAISGRAEARAVSQRAQTRFDRQSFFPQGWQLCVEQFVSLFNRFGYIYKPLSGGSWYSADERWKLTDSEILKAIACVHPRFYLGCRPGRASRFAVLDIDAGSAYHNARSLKKLLAVLAAAGLRKSSLYRSSFSGGWHLYLFFEEPIGCADLRTQLVTLLTLQGFEIAKGKLEVFPHVSQSSQGMGLRLPLQPGFAWLSKETQAVEYERSELDATQALELFIDALDGDANSYTDFRIFKKYIEELRQQKEALAAQMHAAGENNVVPIRKPADPGEYADFVKGVFYRLPPGLSTDSWYRGRLYHLSGLTAAAQRADAIFCLGHYLFYGDPSRDLPALGYGYEQQREWAIKEFLSLHHNGQSKDINRGRGDAIAQAERSAHWLPPHRKNVEAKKYSGNRPISWVRENANRKADARQRIAEALEQLKKQGQSFTTVELQQTAGCSRTTLYKHADIWRQDYEDLAEGFFAICTHEYNAVVGAASSESQPPSTAALKNVPPGLLAARRVAYEISMRSDRSRKNEREASRKSVEVAENIWRGKVQEFTEKPPDLLGVKEQKTLLAVLLGYQSLAPTEEDLTALGQYIGALRTAMNASLGIIHSGAPPPG